MASSSRASAVRTPLDSHLLTSIPGHHHHDDNKPEHRMPGALPYDPARDETYPTPKPSPEKERRLAAELATALELAQELVAFATLG
ncbi:MAG: hypothetical protein L6R39_007425, partial [Caloplaca ligustica]